MHRMCSKLADLTEWVQGEKLYCLCPFWWPTNFTEWILKINDYFYNCYLFVYTDFHKGILSAIRHQGEPGRVKTVNLLLIDKKLGSESFNCTLNRHKGISGCEQMQGCTTSALCACLWPYLVPILNGKAKAAIFVISGNGWYPRWPTTW